MTYYTTGIFIYFISAFLSLFVRAERKAYFVSAANLVAGLLVAVPALGSVFYGEIFSFEINAAFPFDHLRFAIDPLSGFFIALSAFGALLSTFYSSGYMTKYIKEGRNVGAHYLSLQLLIASMVLLPAARECMSFLMIWELMSLSSFFLVIFENEKKEVFDVGIRYLVVMHVSVAFLITGFAYASNLSGSMDFSVFKEFFASNTKGVLLITILLFAGFGIKAGLVPRAKVEAPCHASALMSAFMTKLGIYGMFITVFIFGTPSEVFCYIFLAIAVFTAVFGIMNSLAQNDIKRVLAYSSIENIGIISIGMGCGFLGLSYGSCEMAFAGFAGALLHVMNHSFFKGLLFFGAGAVYATSHSRDMERLGGLIHKMPFCALFFICGAAAICGLPPLNGFAGEFMIYVGLLRSGTSGSTMLMISATLALAFLSFTGAMALLCFTRLSGIVFLGLPRDREINEKIKGKTDPRMLIPMGILAGFCLIAGLLPQFALRVVSNPAGMLFKEGAYLFQHEMSMAMNMISLGSFILLFLIIAGFALRYLLLRKRKNSLSGTWGCGYSNPNARIQYTGSSFSMPFLEILKPFFKRESHSVLPGKGELFPRKSYSAIHFKDVIEEFMLKPLTKAFSYLGPMFSWVQSGSMQQYLLYGILFLMGALVWIIVEGKI
ncbi:MAG: hypothetical protein A2020_15465 [Lentisphaerae bacterium GWF2_45_14]|nr:MAG: hypothetical protein A2020_15465 [Lentisphaerae bacterium GWF2_45_14]